MEVAQLWCLLKGQRAGERGAADVVDQSRVEAKEGLALASTADQAGLAGDGVGEDRVQSEGVAEERWHQGGLGEAIPRGPLRVGPLWMTLFPASRAERWGWRSGLWSG